MPLLLNFKGVYDRLFELSFREEITSLACLLGYGLNYILRW